MIYLPTRRQFLKTAAVAGATAGVFEAGDVFVEVFRITEAAVGVVIAQPAIRRSGRG